MSKTILVSTPHTEFGELLHLTLEENSDFQITLVDSGALMLEKANQNKYDMAILDTAVNDTPFLPLAQNFQSLNPASKLVVVMPQNDANLPDLSVLHVHGFLSRPCYPSDLLKMVDDLIGGQATEEDKPAVEKLQTQKPFISEDELMKNFASTTIEDTFESESPGLDDSIMESSSAKDETLIPNAGEEGTLSIDIPVGAGDKVTTGSIPQLTQNPQILKEPETEVQEKIESMVFPDAEALIAEASAPKSDVSTDVDEFAKELAALTLTFNQEKGKKAAGDIKIQNLDITIKSPFNPQNVEEATPHDGVNRVVTVTDLSESGFIPFSTNLDSTGLDEQTTQKPPNIIVDETFEPAGEQKASSIPEIQMIDTEVRNLERELDAARSTWNEIKQAEKPGIDYDTSAGGDQELSGKHTELSERYGRLAKDYQELAIEHEVLAKEHARMAARKSIIIQQRVESVELAGSLSGLMSKLISGSDALAILVVKNAKILCYSGESNQQAFLELASLLDRDWEKDGKGDLVRFVDLASIKTEFLVYSSVLKNDFILGMAYDTAIPLSKMRSSSGKVSRELDTPQVISNLQAIANLFEDGKNAKTDAGVDVESTIPGDLISPPSVEIQPDNYDTLISLPIEEEIDESDLPSKSTSELEAQSGFEKSLQVEIDNLIQNGATIDEEPATPVLETTVPVVGTSGLLTERPQADVPTLSDILQKPPKTRGKTGRKKGQVIGTSENLQHQETPGENDLVDEAPLISVNAIESSVVPPDNDEDQEVNVGDILNRVRNQLESQYTPSEDERDENELPGWFQEMAALPYEQEVGQSDVLQFQAAEDGLAAHAQPQAGQADTSPATVIQPGQILQGVFDQLESETNPQAEVIDESVPGLINPFQPASATPEAIQSIDLASSEDDLTNEQLGEEEHIPAVESWFEAVHQPGQIETTPNDDIIYPWELNQSDHNPPFDENPTRPVNIWNRIEAEQVYPSGNVPIFEHGGKHADELDPNRNEETPVYEFLTSTADQSQEGSSREQVSPDLDEMTPVTNLPNENSALSAATEISMTSQIRTAGRPRSTLAYTCILVPRLEDTPINEEVAADLGNTLQDTASKLGWKLEKVQVSPDNMLWTVEVMPAVSPGNLVRIVRQRTTRKIFARFPKFKELIPVDDFWAPGFLVISGAEPPPASSLSDFIQQTRKRQKLINALTS